MSISLQNLKSQKKTKFNNNYKYLLHLLPFLDETTHNLNQATQNIVGEILQFVYDKFQLHFSCIYRAPNLSKKNPS